MRKKYYSSISKKYLKEGRGNLSKEEVDAYLIARMPATEAAVVEVLSEVNKKLSTPLRSLLDLGAGTGGASLAAKTVFPEIEKITLIEKNKEMLLRGKELIEGEWVHSDFLNTSLLPHDLVMFSYSFGELGEKEQKEILKNSWGVAKILVVVEPGTPRGFEQVLKARQWLFGWGGYCIAPCPHEKKCPMEGSSKWCHFSARLERTREHRVTKGGTVGWEDEKYSYIAVSKEVIRHTESRIVGHLQKRGGHVLVPLCTEKGLEEKIVSRKEGEIYKRVKKLHWGETFREIG